MEVARHVFETYFSDTVNPMIRHHLDSFSDLLSVKIPRYISAANPAVLLHLEDDREIRVYIGGKDGKKIKYIPPVDDFGDAILPHTCRLENKTYSFKLVADVDIEYDYGSDIDTKSFENIVVGEVPLMLKSSLCHLSSMDSDQLLEAGECKYELGGYFIIGGAEKVLLTQESLGKNLFYAKKRIQAPSKEEVRTLSEKEILKKIEDATKGERYEYIAGINSGSEDGTQGPFVHFLTVPPKNREITDPKEIAKTSDYGKFYTSRLAIIQIPGFTQAVPLISLFRALGFSSDKEIYDVTLCGVVERTRYDSLFMELFLSHEKFVEQEMAKEDDQTQDPDLLFLRRQVRTRSNAGVYINLYEKLFPHCEYREGESASTLYRRKGYALGQMLKMAMDVALGSPDSDRDHFRFKRLEASGELCFSEFIRLYKEVQANMKVQMDRKNEFEKALFKGKNLSNLITYENIEYYWQPFAMLAGFEKSFKGQWSGKDGVAQELARLSYLGTISHLRRVNLTMDKSTKKTEPRKIHSSSWGLMCPIDNPDGHNVGMIKSMTVLSRLSTQTPVSDFLKLIEKQYTPIQLINPAIWNPIWSKLYLNSDLIGVIEKGTEEFHKKLMQIKRSGTISRFISLSWNRTENEYRIFTDAGRPCRPIYREGIKPEQVLKAKNWKFIIDNVMDFVDPEETETLRISMEPFSANMPSEIHGLSILSASAAVMPNSDHNQAPRNMFTCQQAKQACSWYNTAFYKRFDTLAAILNSPQRPISQTWVVPRILGGNGCMPYGQNCIVAVGVYSGYNQDDSILLNKSAVERGMFGTTYYHSYDVLEKMIDIPSKTHTLFANVAENPKYRESVKRNIEMVYDYLDGDGVIIKGSPVSPNTVLVGMVSPVMTPSGMVTEYRDVSYGPKRGQHGVVDAVYKYTTPDGLQGVKIRIAEARSPVLGDKFCLTPDHDVLTTRGWVSIADVTVQDKVYILNRETGEGEYVNPLEHFVFDCDEKLYEVETQGLSLKTTLNHRMWIQTRNSDKFELIEAKDMFGKRVRFQCDAPIAGLDKTFDLDEYHFKDETMDLWLEFLGIWFAEGWTYIKEKDYISRIEIAANKPRVLESLINICSNLDLKYKFNETSKKFYINNKTITEYLHQFNVGAINKSLPEWVFSLSARQSQLLIKCLCLGDGYETPTSLSYYTSSIKLRDQLQQLVQHAGWTSEYVKHYEAGYSHLMTCGRTITCSVDSWKIGIRRTRTRPMLNHGHTKNQNGQKEQLVDYTGKVYCISVPSEVFLVRRNGKCVFTGNSARHGQKGTCGFLIPEADMPYTSSGLRPDLIVNPHAFPSRMTIGQFIETMANKAGVNMGTLVDGTPFSTKNRIFELKEILTSLGYHPYGHEVLYNGMTGEMMETEIFMGPTYYLRLKQMVEDKINYVGRAARKLLTKQPVEGRANEGGLRIGEMERDALLSHGMAGFIHESLMKRSDEHEVLFQPEVGSLSGKDDYPTTVLSMPYALKLFLQEMASMHLSVKLAST